MRARFATIGHSPSEDHWEALRDTLRTMASMADGTCPPKTFVAALDCGLGKSTAALRFASALLASTDHRQVGMIICVGRLREAQDLAKALRDNAGSVAVLTSDKTINALGDAPSVNAAQVLITTQQRVELATAGGGFAATASLHYRAAPRAVRVWDEAWLPGKVAAVREYALSGLLQPLHVVSPDTTRALKAFIRSIDTCADGDCQATGQTDPPATSGTDPLHKLKEV